MTAAPNRPKTASRFKEAGTVSGYFNTLFGFAGKAFLVGMLLCLQLPLTAKAQYTATDSLSLMHSPKKASMYSAILPGLGQAYNKKYWKIPVIYAGFATLGYFIVTNNNKYQDYKDAYIARIDDDPTTVDDYTDVYSDQDLVTLKDFYRRNRDLAIIGAGVLYVLNILDASVDAHMFYFDVNDNLTMRVTPGVQYVQTLQPGLSLSLHF